MTPEDRLKPLGRSVFLRYQALLGKEVLFPDECYQGEYIKDIAELLKEEHGEKLNDKPEQEMIAFCARAAAGIIIKGIRQDLETFGVTFDEWFSEQSLYDSGSVDTVIQELEERDIVYKKDGAVWFKTSQYQDEKDRVVVRKNGQKTYFASDVAYHLNKYRRGFERVIDVWGADHHGYIPRMTASIEALGYRRDQFEVILVQLVNLLRDGEPVAMSTRAGEFITLKDVVDEVGRDAARFIFLTRHYESPLDFDLELAKKKTNDNPVYYVQYVHARISSILRKGREQGIDSDAWDDLTMKQLVEPEEINLIKAMDQYPAVVEKSAVFREPHRITYYLMSLASTFHSYYNKHRVLADRLRGDTGPTFPCAGSSKNYSKRIDPSGCFRTGKDVDEENDRKKRCCEKQKEIPAAVDRKRIFPGSLPAVSDFRMDVCAGGLGWSWNGSGEF